MPEIAAAIENAHCQQYQRDHSQRWNPPGSRGKLILIRSGCGHGLIAAGQVEFGEQILFVQAQVSGDGADESAAENAAGKLVPLFIFDGLEKLRADAGAASHFGQGHLAHFALALHLFAEITFGHVQEACTNYDSKVVATRRTKREV